MIDRFRVLTPGRQWMVVFGGALLLAAILAAVWASMRTTYQPLYTQLKAGDAAAVVAELDRRKTDYRLADGGTTILVPADKVDATRLALSGQTMTLKGVVGFELFNKSDLGLTDFAQRINYQRALQGELERTIMSLDGVDSARVHLSLGEDRLFREDRVAPKASVTLHMNPGAAIDSQVAGGVQRLVAAAVPQLQPHDVVILDEKGEVVATSDTGDVSGPQDEHQAVGQFYAAKIRQALAPILGEGIKIEVTAGNPPETAATTDQDDVFSAATRNFPLAVILTSADPIDPTQRQQAQSLVAQAIAFDAAKGDTISFEQALAPHRPHPAYAFDRNPTMATTPPVDPLAGLPTLYLAIGGGVAFLLAVLALIARRRGPRRLSEKQRQRMAARLTHLVEQESGDHAAIR